MTERKFTDEEIVKALETVSYGGRSCEKCKFKIRKGDDRCGLKGCNVCRLALDLINRKNAEIESLKKILHELKMEAEMVYKQRDVLKKQVDTQKAEIERYEAQRQEIFDKCTKILAKLEEIKESVQIDIAMAKSEAIKEFWNELKRRNTLDYRIVSTITGDNLVKELTEENKGQAVSV